MNAQTKIEADPTAQLEAALADALPKLEGVQKNRENAAFKNGGKASKYADLGSVIEAIRPVAEHGVWFRQVLHEGDKGVTVETLYTGFGTTITAGTLFMPSDKTNAQGFGSALTYARRYALVTAFGLSTEDDDGNEGSRQPQRNQQSTAQPDQRASNDGDGSVNPAQLSKLKLMLDAINLTETEWLRKFGAPKGAQLHQLPETRFRDAVEDLEDRMAHAARQKGNQAGQDSGDIADTDIPY